MKKTKNKRNSTKKVKGCWTARQYKKGWKLGFSTTDSQKISYLAPYFTTVEDVEAALNCSVVFIHLSKNKS